MTKLPPKNDFANVAGKWIFKFCGKGSRVVDFFYWTLYINFFCEKYLAFKSDACDCEMSGLKKKKLLIKQKLWKF